MRAAWYEAYGPAADVLQLGEMDDPEPGPGEVRVKIAASSVNPIDFKVRGGIWGDSPGQRVIPHCDGAGVIDKVGAGVDPSRIGQRVWLHFIIRGLGLGTAAEYAIAPAENAAPLPDNVGFTEGSTLAIPGMTAHFGVFADGPVNGKTVLVTGGAGAVGSIAVQLAKDGGATVIATISGDKKAEYARAAGADHTINYKTEDVTQRIKEITGGDGVDRIVEVEFGGNLATSLAVLKLNGTIAAYASEAEREPKLPFYPMLFHNGNIRAYAVFNIPRPAMDQAVADLNRFSASGKMKFPVGGVFPLDSIAAAHEAGESAKLFGVAVVEIT